MHHCLNDAIEAYLTKSRPALMKSEKPTNALWISSRTGQRYTTKNLAARRPTKVAAIALANKLARMAWAMMAKGERYNYPASLRV